VRKPDVPQDETQRLRALHGLSILDTPPEERFDRFTRLARRLFGVPIALVSLVDSERQWFKSRQGLEATETPREISFCGHAILGTRALVVPDALEDERFADNPLVTGAPHIRFYAGHPIAAPDGHKLGTVCLIDREPRDLASDELELLRDLARMVEDEIAALALATVDELTGLSNRRGFQSIASKALAVCDRLARSATLLFFDLDHFKQINDSFGHAVGDRALQEVAQLLLECFRESDVVARLGGDEFSVLLTGMPEEEVAVPLTRLERRVSERNADPDRLHGLEYSVGAVSYDAERHRSLGELLHEADQLMFEHKRAGRSAQLRSG
jgi:diguanylate cyclase (GGDEF)-like protein